MSRHDVKLLSTGISSDGHGNIYIYVYLYMHIYMYINLSLYIHIQGGISMSRHEVELLSTGFSSDGHGNINAGEFIDTVQTILYNRRVERDSIAEKKRYLHVYIYICINIHCL
jgi:hypothetical protein